MHGDVQGFGEYDLVVVSPGGQLLIVEVVLSANALGELIDSHQVSH